jgi:hypothetical protein
MELGCPFSEQCVRKRDAGKVSKDSLPDACVREVAQAITFASMHAQRMGFRSSDQALDRVTPD